ncbi:hypothetical protein Tco_1221171 [Tanacetum coccineum]
MLIESTKEYISPYGKVAKTTIHLLTPPKDFHAIPNMIIESLPTFPIPVEDSDSLREEIDIFPGPDDSIPPGIESDDYDSKDDDNSTSFPEFKSFHVDYPDSGDSTIDMVEDIKVEPSQCRKIPICYEDDDDEYSFATQEYLKKFSFAIIPDLPKSDSLIMEDKHLDTIPEPKSDELIKSCVEDLVHTPSKSDGISESECDLLVCDDSSPKKDEIDFLLEEFAGELALIALIPPRGMLEADFDPREISFYENWMYDNSFPRPLETLKDDSETVIDSNNAYSSSDDVSPYSEDIDYVDALPSDPELISLEVRRVVAVPVLMLIFLFPEYDSFHLDSKPDSGDFTMDVVEDIFDNPTREPRVHVPNVLPTLPTHHLDSDFTLSSDSLGSDLVVSFPSETRNTIFDLGIFIGIQSKRFLSPDEFFYSLS